MRRRSMLCASLVVLAGAAADAAAVSEPDGYRMDDYRAPVPDTVSGAAVLHAPEVHALLERGAAILIDVLPAPRRPPAMRPGTPWLPVARRDVPGSLWWPDVGRGALPAHVDEQFRERLAALAAARPGIPIVFYCLRDCWMSWNAAKRAASYGIQAAWFPEGLDGWQDAGYSLQDAIPDFLD